MKFTFETDYNQKAMTTMARALRKTIRRKRSRRAHIFGWIVVVLGLLLSLPLGEREFVIGFKPVITWLAVLVILVVLILEDHINGYIARKRILPGTEKATAVFHEDGFHSTTEIGETDWHYDKVGFIAETAEYFVFMFSISHAQVYDKQRLSGGTVEEFRTFIEDKTGKRILPVK